MKEIELTNGMKSKVDDEDFVYLNSFRWSAYRSGRNGLFYAAIRINEGKKRKNGKPQESVIFMHHLVMKSRSLFDHKDTDGLNNTKKNLRSATRSQNNANRNRWRKITTSSFKGVFRKRYSWTAKICVDYKQIYLGSFKDEVSAAIAYDTAAKKHFGEFARTNFGENSCLN